MLKKCFILLCLFVFQDVRGQNKVIVAAQYQFNTLYGGFDYTIPQRGVGNQIRLDYSHAVDSSFYGYSVGLVYGKKSFVTGYPLFYAAGIEPDIYAVVDAQRYGMGYAFPFMGIFAGGMLRAGRFVEFKPAIYADYNGTRILEEYLGGIDGTIFYPYSPSTLWKRIELGGQLQLNVQVPIGRHFSIGLTGSIGRSFNDLRKDKWEDATALLLLSPIGSTYYYDWQSRKLTDKFTTWGIQMGYSW